MAIEDILVAVDGQAEAEIERILADADDRAREIIAQAHRKKQAEIERFVAEKVELQRKESERQINAAHTANRRALADVRRGVFEAVFVLAEERLQTLRHDPAYPKILPRLIDEAVAGIKGKCHVHVDKRDVDLVTGTYCGSLVTGDLETAGGAVVVSEDGRVKRSNTVEDRLERIHDERVREISEVLYQ